MLIYQKTILQFSLAFYNNNNFSRKNIEIQEYVKLYIITPLLDTFTNFAKSTFFPLLCLIVFLF